MLNKLSKEELELLSYAKIAEMYLKENKEKQAHPAQKAVSG